MKVVYVERDTWEIGLCSGFKSELHPSLVSKMRNDAVQTITANLCSSDLLMRAVSGLLASLLLMIC